ncbi:MAG: hypothetical protein AAF357_13555 [Verrucomicrobiota bacterium]
MKSKHDEIQIAENHEVSIKPLLILGGAALVLSFLFGLIVVCSIRSWEQRGQFGDMFGGLNALFSGLAFAGVVYAILLQRKELALQREEMRRSWKELAFQNELITQQLLTMREAHEFELSAAIRSSRPRFRLHNSTRSANNRVIDTYNLGGKITDISIVVTQPESGISISVEPSDVWDTNGKAVLRVIGFGGMPCPDCEFELSFTNEMGETISTLFALAGNEDQLTEIQGAERDCRKTR